MSEPDYSLPLQALRQGRQDAIDTQNRLADQSAGNAFANGDYTGGVNALYKSGQLDTANAFQTQQLQRQKQEMADRLTFMGQAAQALSQIPDAINGQPDPNHTARRAALQSLMPTLQAMGIPADTLQNIQQMDLSDPSLSAVGAKIGQELKFFNVEGLGLVAGNERTGQAKLAMAAPGKPDWKEVTNPDGSTTYVDLNDPRNQMGGASSGGPSQQAASAAAATPASATPSADQVWQNIVQQESGGKPGVVGQPTKYGQALGETQLLPATAKEMAQKLGVPWRPDLLTGTTPEAQAYQLKLGRAYFDQGLAANNGDVAQAAAYYYGGPNPALHGPKTQAYVQAVTGGGASATPTLQGGQGADTAAPQYAGRRVPGSSAQKDSGLTQDATDMNAMRFAMTGQLPQEWGKIGTADKQKIMNRAAEITKQYNIKPEDWVTGMAQFKVTQGSLQQTSKTLATLIPSEQAVNANLQLALSLAPKGGGGTNIPVFNRWIQAGRKATGDVDVTNFQQALQTVAVEYGKVMGATQGGNNQSLTDDARKDAYSRLNSAQTLGQLQGRLQVIQREMENKVNAFRQEQDALTSQLHNGIVPAGATPTGAPLPAGGSPGVSGQDVISQARDAIARGAPRAAVIQRLRQNGINPAGL